VVTREAYTLLIAALALERCFELWLSRRNALWAKRSGAVEYGAEHLVWMKLLHTGLFVGCVAEVWLLPRPFVPWLAAACLVVAALAQALRYWTIATLGRRWNVQVLVLPGVPVVGSGPFRFLRHPNYLAVVAEGVAVPLVHSAFITAGVFSVLNAALLAVRIRCEERALREHCQYSERLGERRRFWPARSTSRSIRSSSS
jgi:methyltransferase